MDEDPVFSRDGADIYVESNISFTQVRAKYILVVSHTHVAHLIKDGIDLSILDVLPTMVELRENHFLLPCVASSSTVRQAEKHKQIKIMQIIQAI